MYPNPLGYKLYESEKDYAEPKNWAEVLEALTYLNFLEVRVTPQAQELVAIFETRMVAL